jgi:hypothetical protein
VTVFAHDGDEILVSNPSKEPMDVPLIAAEPID